MGLRYWLCVQDQTPNEAFGVKLFVLGMRVPQKFIYYLSPPPGGEETSGLVSKGELQVTALAGKKLAF